MSNTIRLILTLVALALMCRASYVWGKMDQREKQDAEAYLNGRCVK